MKILNISKSYKKNTRVLDDINLTVYENQLVCLLGRNGAGKSTLLNIISQIIPQDSGSIIINGTIFNQNSIFIKEKIGVLSQFDFLINELTGYQYLKFQCLLFNIPERVASIRIESLVEYFFDDINDIHKYIVSFSAGMRVKLNIISILMHDPKILLLDEPFSNLDPIAAQKFVLLLNKFVAKNNNRVLLSSHDLLYVNMCATNICVLDNSKLIFNGTKDEFTKDDLNKIDEALIDLITPEEFYTTGINWLC